MKLRDTVIVFGLIILLNFSAGCEEQRGADSLPLDGDLVCTAELEKEVFIQGEEIKIGARLRNVSKRTLKFRDYRPLLIENIRIRTQSGQILQYAKRRPERVSEALKSSPVTWLPGMDRYTGQLQVRGAYNITDPGVYTVRVRWPLDAEASEFVESKDVHIRVLPKGSLGISLRLTKVQSIPINAIVFPVELVFVNKLLPSEELTNVTVVFTASSTDDRAILLSGIPDPRESPHRRTWRQHGKTKVTFNLALAQWHRMISSESPNKSIWDFVKSGQNLRIVARVRGLLSKKRFSLVTDAVEVKVKQSTEQSTPADKPRR